MPSWTRSYGSWRKFKEARESSFRAARNINTQRPRLQADKKEQQENVAPPKFDAKEPQKSTPEKIAAVPGVVPPPLHKPQDRPPTQGGGDVPNRDQNIAPPALNATQEALSNGPGLPTDGENKAHTTGEARDEPCAARPETLPCPKEPSNSFTPAVNTPEPLPEVDPKSPAHPSQSEIDTRVPHQGNTDEPLPEVDFKSPAHPGPSEIDTRVPHQGNTDEAICPASRNSLVLSTEESLISADKTLLKTGGTKISSVTQSPPPSSPPEAKNNNPSQPLPLTRDALQALGTTMDNTPRVKREEQLNVRSPDLTTYRAPRPNPKYSGSSPSLPSVSSMNISETGIEKPGIAEDARSSGKDIRNEIAPKHTLQDYGQKWVKSNWANEGDHDEVLFSPAFVQHFVVSWVSDVPNNIRAEFLQQNIPGHWDCDVDTDTGLLMQPVSYPSAMVDLSQLDQATAWRQQNWTSSLLIRRENMRLDRVKNQRLGPPRGWTETTVGPATSGNVIKPDAVVKVYEPEPNPHAPRVPCHMRPARKEDMESVRAIYNMEVEHGLQAGDTSPLSLEDFHNIFSTTQELKMPFVVVISGPYQGTAEDNGAQHAKRRNQPRQKSSGQVIAFGYLSVWEPGLAGGMKGRSRMTARVNIYVHRGYQAKKLGHACLDKLLSTVSNRHAAKVASGCEFVNASDDPVYKYPRHHERKYYSVYLYHYVKTKTPANNNTSFVGADSDGGNAEEGLKVMEKYLSGCRFENVARFRACHRTRPDRTPCPLWLDAVVFEHVCQTDLNFTHQY